MMKLEGEQVIPLPRQQVWDGLNDPEVLKACIPGCLELAPSGPDGYEATVQAKIGPVKAKFKGTVTLSDINEPTSYTISGEGKGGAAGFAKGAAEVTLKDTDNGGTLLSYAVDAKVGGKLAQIGSRLVDASAKKLAGDFFETFTEELSKRNTPVRDAPENEAPENEAPDNNVQDHDAPDQGQDVDETDHPRGKTPLETDPVAAAAPTAAPGLHPGLWVVGVVVIAGILIYLFSS